VTEPPVRHLVVDGANVVGARPDGWWRDRPGAARRLAGRLVGALTADPAGLAALGGGATGSAVVVHLVLEGAARVDDPPTHPRLDVVCAPADGDATIAALAADLRGGDLRGGDLRGGDLRGGDPPGGDVVVVTADRGLRARVEACGAATVGPGALLRVLPDQPTQPA
jgi:hypothetical protein